MHYSARFIADIARTDTELLVWPVFSDGDHKLPGEQAAAISARVGGMIKSGDFKAAVGSTETIWDPAGLAATRLLLVGCGKHREWNADKALQVLAAAANRMASLPVKSATLVAPDVPGERNAEWLGRQVAMHCTRAGYQYDHTLSKKKDPVSLRRLTLAVSKSAAKSSERGLTAGHAIATGQNYARQLGNLPANICTPTYLAGEARALARKQPRLTTRVLEEKQMRELGMGALLSVSAGSVQPAKLIVMEYRGHGAKGDKPVVLVGKGVTFDSGGISLKPGPKMDEMKFDMCGAASVFGVIRALLELQADINVVGIVPATENLPAGNATKPGDVITSMAGKTIEILNTDAEGRLLLCDALTYAERYQPKAVIDIATLTGAIIVSLGNIHTGLFSNHQPLADRLLAAGLESGDIAWQMPLGPRYEEQLKSNFADLANIGGPGAGSVTAACFLAKFTGKFHWAHLDIAGTAWPNGADKAATGRPVPLLMSYLLGYR